MPEADFPWDLTVKVPLCIRNLPSRCNGKTSKVTNLQLYLSVFLQDVIQLNTFSDKIQQEVIVGCKCSFMGINVQHDLKVEKKKNPKPQ